MARVITVWIVLFMLAITSYSQSTFVKVDEEYPTWIDKMTTTDQGVVVFSPKSDIGYKRASFRLSSWNGLFWTGLPTIEATNVFYGSANNLEVGSYNNKVVIAGSFYSQGEAIKGITQWDGQNWVQMGGGINTSRLIHDEFSISDLSEFDGQLFVCGDFNLANDLPVNNFIRLKDGNWQGINNTVGDIRDLQAIGDSLYIAGDISLVDGVVCNNLALYTNAKWQAVVNTFSEPILKLGSFNAKLVAVTPAGFYIYGPTSWTRFGSALDVLEVEDIVEYEGRLFCTGLFVQNGQDSLRLIAISENDVTVYLRDDEIKSNVSNKVLLQEFGETLFLAGSFNHLKNKPYKNIAAFKPGKSVVEGFVYLDKNANCVFDAEDVPKVNAIVSLNDGESYTSTNEDGYYSIFIQNSKTSKIEIFPTFEEEALCNGAERTVVASSSDSLLIEDFALKLNKMSPIRLSYKGASGFRVKHGYEANYILDCSTIDPTHFPIKLSLEYDQRLSDMTSSLSPNSKQNGVVTWELKENATIELSFTVTANAISMDEQLSFKSYAASFTKEAEQYDNLSQVVVSAYDPNDKQCDKSDLTTTEENLSFQVRFQNMGNDNARDIHIVDTIDNGIPIEYIQIRKNSHFREYATSYKVRGHAIVWSFKDIELPPKSQVGDDESSGFVAYDCGLEGVLTVGQRFTNKAYIYFDFQPPVITNTTESIVRDTDTSTHNRVEEFVVYPNPTSDELHVKSKRLKILQATLYGVDAKLIKTVRPFDSLEAGIDVSHLPSGVYFVRIDHLLGSEVKQIIVD